MPDLWSELLTCLDLRQRPTSPASGATETRPATDGRRRETLTVYEGPSQRLDHGWLYGGQLLAQIVRAAMCACPAKAVESLHVVFAHEGKGDSPVFHIVQRRHEGRSFAALTVTARQKRDVVATAVTPPSPTTEWTPPWTRIAGRTVTTPREAPIGSSSGQPAA
ncbi:acyl-CoA thioesterase domain-containing protein [Nocardia gamkensis]|uniref:acyl-CoA thioesterase domain-containing protein n=1 Tax=Nocardia gamkensis TaxID=352869 RepID=UPI0037CA208A